MSVEDLVSAHTRDELDALAVEAGVENPEELPNKEEVAAAILDARGDAPADDAGSEDEEASQEDAGPDYAPEQSDEDVQAAREDEFRRTFGHIEDEDTLATARSVSEANWALEDKINALPGYVGGEEPVVVEESAE